MKPFFFACFGAIGANVGYSDNNWTMYGKDRKEVVLKIPMSLSLYQSADIMRTMTNVLITHLDEGKCDQVAKFAKSVVDFAEKIIDFDIHVAEPTEDGAE